MNRFPPNDPPRPSRLKGLPPEEPEWYFERLESAIICAQLTMEPADGAPRDEACIRDYQANADDMQCSLLAAIVLHLMSPTDGPEYTLRYTEGPVPGQLALDPEGRSVTHAFACIATPRGEMIQAGPLHRDPDGLWVCQVEEPTDPRLEDAVSFVIGIGAPAVNG